MNRTSPAKLEVRRLRGGYRKIEVVHGIDLSLDGGEVVALFGPNGAGKTTALLTLMGMLPRLGGEVRWSGAERKAPAARAGDIAFVGERAVFHQLSTEANLRLGRGSLDKALELFPELHQLLKRRAGLLSGGEQQMLAVARALAGEPSVLILDEVSSGLAPLIVGRLFEAIRAAADRGVAVLLVEQQARKALAITDRGYILNLGKIVHSASRDDLSRSTDLMAASYFSKPGDSQA